MDFQTTSAAHDPLTATLHNKAEENELTNTDHDMFKFGFTYNAGAPTGPGQTVENPAYEFHDAINYLLNTVPLLLEEIRKNDQSRSTVVETTDADNNHPVPQRAINAGHTAHSSILLHESSSLPISNIADRYTRSMLKCLVGYPLYNPKPSSNLSKEYLRNGVNVGDVGFVRGDGTFDFLFNIWRSKYGPINPPDLSDGFSFEIPDHLRTRDMEQFLHNTCLFQNPITKTRSGEYVCEGSEGAVLELPEGATRVEATHIRTFAKLAAQHGVQWYEYVTAQGREISNGSLYLVTSVTKCAQWGIAVFDRPCAPGQGLRFNKEKSLPFGKSTPKYNWTCSHIFPSTVSDLDQGDAPNQCVFLRGYKIMIRPDIFDNLCKDLPRTSDPTMSSSSIQAGRQPPTHRRGEDGSDFMSKRLIDEELTLHPKLNSPLVHPSDLINTTLLSQNRGAKIALTHDDIWCDLLRDNFPKVNYATLINTARSYTNTVDKYDCISIEKISDSSKNHSIQGTGSPVQIPLTITDEHYASAPPTVSLTLPHELLERIFLLLDIKSMLRCRLVDREFNQIIQSSTLLQYSLACKAAGVVDNSHSPFNYAERLEALRKHEDAWTKLKPVFETMIEVHNQPSTFYELTAGNYFLGDKDQNDLYWCHLPSSSQDDPKWIRIPGHGLGQNPFGFINDMGMAIYEHDLIINVISSPVENQAGPQQHSLDLVFLKFSTGTYHPLARHPRIHVQRSFSSGPWVVSRIVGDNLALVVHSRNGRFADTLFIFDWKTGHKRLEHKAPEGTYASLVFVSPELLLVFHLIRCQFEVWHIPHSDNPPTQILALQIPAISGSFSIIGADFYGELTPFLHSMPYFPPRPFFPSPESSIIIFNFLLQHFIGPDQHAYTLVMSRPALLDLIQKWTSPSLLGQHEPSWWTNEVTLHKVVDPDDGSVRFTAQSKFVDIMLDPESLQTRDVPTFAPCPTSSNFSTSHVSADSSSGSSVAPSASQYDIPLVQWADWGPPLSRWFQIDETYAWCINQSTGQRYAFLDHNPRDWTKRLIQVADFNPHNVRKNEEMIARIRKAIYGINDEKKEQREEELEILDHEGVFSEVVYMGLKCVISYTQREYDFDAVLMDEERLVGLRLDDDHRVQSIRVLYIG